MTTDVELVINVARCRTHQWLIGGLALALAACTETPSLPAPSDSTVETTPAATTVSPPGTAPLTPPPMPMPTTLPPSFVDRPPYPSCGEDDSLSLDGMGPPSTARQCFLTANRKAGPAELTSQEISDLGPATHLVYRTNEDRSVDVYLAGTTWRLVQCTGLDADARVVFRVVGCADPIELS